MSAPAGWSVHPREIPLSIDGETDDCTLGKDIMIKMEGFTVEGKVERVTDSNEEDGPASGDIVNMELVIEGKEGEVKTAVTDKNGRYFYDKYGVPCDVSD